MRSRFPLSFALLCAGLSLTGGVARAQTASVIAELHATGSARYNDAKLEAAIGIKPGDSVTAERLQQAANLLGQSGFFSRVDYHFTSKGQRIIVTFELTDISVVPAAFDNFPWFTDDEILAAIRKKMPLFDGTAPPSGQLPDTIAETLAELLTDRGIKGTVEYTAVAQPESNALLLQFRVNGPALTIGSLEYTDDLAKNSEKLHDRNADLTGKPYSRFAIEVFENEQVRPLYLAAGNLRVRFAAPSAAFPADSKLTSGGSLMVTIPVNPGPAFRVTSFTWSGETVFPSPSLTTMLGIKTGELADGIRMAAAWQHVENAYAHLGYLDVKLVPDPDYDNANATVGYKIAVSEGPQYHMGTLSVTGLSPEAEQRFRLAWRLVPNEVFDGNFFDDLLAKFQSPPPDIFGALPVHYGQVNHLLQPNATTHTVDVMLDFQ